MDRPEKRVAEFEARLYELAERAGGVEMVFAVLSEAMKSAQMTVRAPKLGVDGKEGEGYCYTWAPDHAIRVTAARTLAQMLGLIKQSVGMTVNNGPQQTLNVTTGERLAELDAIGVPRELIAKGCEDLLAASSVSLPAKDAQKGEKSGP